jgi:hypothetical protein
MQGEGREESMVVREGIGRRSLVERSLALTEFGLGRI